MTTPPAQLPLLPDARPDGLLYLEHYISRAAAGRLIAQIDAAPWRSDLKRRVQHYGYRYDYKARKARREDHLGPLPEPLGLLAQRLAAEGHFRTVPDQVIVNEYLPGQGISAHIDCAPCFGETIASLSLLSACVMRFAAREPARRFDLLLRPCSLVILTGQARHGWTHAIPPRKSDLIGGHRHRRERRVSLTFRTMRHDPGSGAATHAASVLCPPATVKALVKTPKAKTSGGKL